MKLEGRIWQLGGQMARWLSGYVTWIAYLEAMERVGGMGSNPRNKVAYHTTTTTTTTMTSSTSSSDHHDLHARMVLLWPQNPQPTPQPFQTTQPIPLHTHLIPQVHLSLINPIHAVASTWSSRCMPPLLWLLLISGGSLLAETMIDALRFMGFFISWVGVCYLHIYKL